MKSIYFILNYQFYFFLNYDILILICGDDIDVGPSPARSEPDGGMRVIFDKVCMIHRSQNGVPLGTHPK
jgi:hypothetical protein